MLSVPKYVGLLAVCGSLLCAAPAGATVIEHEKFHDEYSEDFKDCGLTLHLEGVADGQFVTRAGRGAEAGAFFGHANYAYRDVVTNTATGRFVVITGRAAFQEVKATPVEGTIFEFTAVEAGQPFALTDMDGNVVLRDRGAIRSVILFDTLGDNQPGGELVELISEQAFGPHPGFDLSEQEFCATVVPLLT